MNWLQQNIPFYDLNGKVRSYQSVLKNSPPEEVIGWCQIRQQEVTYYKSEENGELCYREKK